MWQSFIFLVSMSGFCRRRNTERRENAAATGGRHVFQVMWTIFLLNPITFFPALTRTFQLSSSQQPEWTGFMCFIFNLSRLTENFFWTLQQQQQLVWCFQRSCDAPQSGGIKISPCLSELSTNFQTQRGGESRSAVLRWDETSRTNGQLSWWFTFKRHAGFAIEQKCVE